MRERFASLEISRIASLCSVRGLQDILKRRVVFVLVLLGGYLAFQLEAELGHRPALRKVDQDDLVRVPRGLAEYCGIPGLPSSASPEPRL